MKPVNNKFAAAAFSLAALGAPAAQATGVEMLNEGFGNVNGLDGWARVNHSEQPGNGWFQGNPGLFASHTGAADSYATANFLSAANGSGRFAFRYFGPADTLNYVGLDSVRVVTAVPEPSALAMLGAGPGLPGLRRRIVHA